MAVFGGLVLSAALPVLGLPETRGKPLVQTVDQVNISRVFDDGDVIHKRQAASANSPPGWQLVVQSSTVCFIKLNHLMLLMLTMGADIVCFRKIFLEKLYLLKRNIDIGNIHKILQLSSEKQETCAKTIPEEDVRT